MDIVRRNSVLVTWGLKGLTSSSCQYQRKCTEMSIENVDTDVRVGRVTGEPLNC